MKFINFAPLNTQRRDTGNEELPGDNRLSCGFWGIEPEGYMNVPALGGKHHSYAKTGSLAYFMKKIRKADPNLIKGEWAGWGSRPDPAKASRVRAIVGRTDPVTLGYWGAKYLLYPLSRNKDFHDPDYPGGSVRKFLNLALDTLGEGTLDEKKMEIRIYNSNISPEKRV